MRIDSDGAYMTMDEFEGLPEYSCTVPTGTTVGKRWRREEPYHRQALGPRTWYMGEYGEPGEDRQVPITWRQIFIVPEAGTYERGTTRRTLTIPDAEEIEVDGPLPAEVVVRLAP